MYLKNSFKRIQESIFHYHLLNSHKKRIRNLKSINTELVDFKLDEHIIEEHRNIWSGISKKIDIDWLKFYVFVTKNPSPYFVPDDIYYLFIEPSLNYLALAKAYSDKNNYHKLFNGFKQPNVILRNIFGKFYSSDYSVIPSELELYYYLKQFNGNFIIKPSIADGGGKNIIKVSLKDGNIFHNDDSISIDTLLNTYKQDFLIQKYMGQHSLLKSFHPNSLNCLRFFSYRIDSEIIILSSVFKMGNMGSFLDGQRQGSLICGIKNSKLNDYAFNSKDFLFFNTHPYTNTSFANKELPFYNQTVEFVKELHKNLLYFNIASWDIGIDENGYPSLIEVNLSFQAITLMQANSGPLFGEYTIRMIESIIDNLRKRRYYSFKP